MQSIHSDGSGTQEELEEADPKHHEITSWIK